MRNGVFQRLIGEDMKDGLTTVSPHKDEQGRHTILKDLGVKHASFMALLQFLRTRTIRERDLQEAYDVTLRIGGLSAMDKHMRERREKFSCYNPLKPEEDTEHLYSWSIMHVNHSKELIILANEGWSVTTNFNDYAVFMRKPTPHGTGSAR